MCVPFSHPICKRTHMKNYRLIAAAVLIAASAARADTVSLANGDKVTGEIVEVNPKSVIVTTPYAGRLVIDRAAVKTLQSEKAVPMVGEAQAAALEPKFLSPTP